MSMLIINPGFKQPEWSPCTNIWPPTDKDIVPEENLEEVNSVLSDTNWDAPNVEELRPVRNRLCELMGIPAPAVVKKVVA